MQYAIAACSDRHYDLLVDPAAIRRLAAALRMEQRTIKFNGVTAIGFGATSVRVGSAIFGERVYG